MITMKSKIAAMPGFSWTQVDEAEFVNYVDKYFLVCQNCGKDRKYYDCETDAITAIKEINKTEEGFWEYIYYIQKENKK